MKRLMNLRVCLAAAALTVATALGAQDKRSPTPASVRSVVESNRRALWRDSVQAPSDAGASSELKESLQDSCRQLDAIPLPKPDPEPRSPLADQLKEDKPKADTPPETKPTLDDKTLEELKKTRSVPAPAALAGVLFLGGHRDVAARFYEIATAVESDSRDKAWLLFQAANCHREIDPKAAAAAYEKLLAEHPESVWSPIAKIQKDLLDWRSTDPLAGMLKEVDALGQLQIDTASRK
jgi:hypothetical protein